MKLLILILLFTSISLYSQDIVSNNFTIPAECNRKLYSHELIRSINSNLTTNPARKDHFIFLYFTIKPNSDELHKLTEKGVKLYPKSFIPQVGNHPYCFMLGKVIVDSIVPVMKLDFVKLVADAEQKLYPQNNLVEKAIKADSVNSVGYSGEKVRIAFLDSGLDLGYKSDELPPTIIAFDYSAYPDSMDIEVYNKVTGHGTHVVGCAMAKGILSKNNQANGGGSYNGPSPNSGLVFLKIGDDKTAACTVKGLQGAAYDAVTEYKANLISLSYASDDIYNDGSSAMEQTIDWIADQGVPVICAAGNARHTGEHYSQKLGAGEFSPYIQVNLNKIVYSAKPSINLVWTDLLNENDFDINYYDDKKQLINNVLKYQTTTSPRSTGSLISNALIENSKGIISYYVRIENKTNQQNKYHLYLYDLNIVANTENSAFSTPDTLGTILWPSTADSAFCVGSYVTRNSWVSSNGKTVTNSDRLGGVSSFSGCGPRIDGLQKPDIIAPGESIISLRDRSIYNIPSDRFIDNDGNTEGPANYYIMKGTSMAAPVVAGATALILSRSPKAKPYQIYKALRESAVRDSLTGLNVNSTAGWGKLDAYKAINSNTVPDIITVKPEKTIICGTDPFKVTLKTNSKFAEDNVFEIQLSDVNGKFLKTTAIATGVLDSLNQIECVISANVPSSSKYRIRAVSTSPEIFSAYNDKDLSISDFPEPKIKGDSICCHSILYTYTTQTEDYIKNSWTVTGGVITKEDNNSISIMWVDKQKGDLVLESTNTLTNCKAQVDRPVRLRVSPSANVVGDFVVCNAPDYKYSVGIRPGENAFWYVYGGEIIDSASNFIAVKWADVEKCGFTTIVTDDTCNISKEYEVMNLSAKVNGISGETQVIENCIYEYKTTLSNKVFDYWTINGGTILDSMTGKVTIRWIRSGNASLKLARHTQTCSFLHDDNITVADIFGAILSGKLQVCENSIEEYVISNPDTAEYHWEISGGNVIENKGDTVLILWDKAGNGRIKLIKSKVFRNYLDTLVQFTTILKKPVAKLSKLPKLCQNAQPYTLNEGSPYGGYYAGQGITDNIFHPELVQPGKITIKYIYFDNPNCKDTVEGIIDVFPEPQTPELIRRNDTLIAVGNEDYYNWYKDNNLIMEYGRNTYFPLKNGYYSIEAINLDSCKSDISNLVLVENTGVFDIANSALYELLPNPAKDFIILKSPNLIYGTYTVFDLQGKTIQSGNLKGYSTKINISFFKSGVYVLQFSLVNDVYRKIFVKI